MRWVADFRPRGEFLPVAWVFMRDMAALVTPRRSADRHQPPIAAPSSAVDFQVIDKQSVTR